MNVKGGTGTGAQKVWGYCLQDIADACGLSLDGVRKATVPRRKGAKPRLDLDDLVSVAAFIVAHQRST